MSWEDILKNEDKKVLLENLMRECHWLSDEINDDGGKLDELHNHLYQKIKPLLTNEQVNQYQGDLAEAEKLWDEAWTKKEEYSRSLEDLGHFFEQVLHDLEDKEDDGGNGEYASTPSGGVGKVYPPYIGYKLKDDEQWGEAIMEDGKAYLVPKPLDDMYGAEW